MIEQAKIDAIRKYLQSEFPGFQIDDADDFDLASQKFRAFNGSTLHIGKFERIFLDDTSDIKKALQDLELSKFMQLNAGRQVLVTKKGLMVL
jgi:hypothetical protein